MDAREYRKKAMRLRTMAVAETRPEVRDSYRAVASVYEGLAHALDTLVSIQREAGALSAPAKTYQFRREPSGRY